LRHPNAVGGLRAGRAVGEGRWAHTSGANGGAGRWAFEKKLSLFLWWSWSGPIRSGPRALGTQKPRARVLSSLLPDLPPRFQAPSHGRDPQLSGTWYWHHGRPTPGQGRGEAGTGWRWRRRERAVDGWRLGLWPGRLPRGHRAAWVWGPTPGLRGHALRPASQATATRQHRRGQWRGHWARRPAGLPHPHAP